MEPIRDPDQVETRLLKQTIDLEGSRVIEIGCGDGRLTWRYAPQAGWVTGIDPDVESLSSALMDRPPGLNNKVQFVNSNAENLPFTDGSFQVALFAWSL